MNKKLSVALNVLLYAAGFPVLFIVALVSSLEWNSYGMYGASAFAPLIAVVIIAALTLGVQALVYNVEKKKGRKNIAIKMAVIPVAIIVGIFAILDIAMPPLLKDATSNTILYEDVVFDAKGVHQKLYDRVELFKQKNGLDESVTYQSEEFQAIFKPIFTSMDKAYNAFDPLAIEIALDSPDLVSAILNGDFPVSVAATLLVRTTDAKKDPNGNNHNADLKSLLTLNLKSILAAVNQIKDEGLDTSSEGLNKLFNKILVTKTFDVDGEYKNDGSGIEWNIFNILGSNMIAPDIDPNAQIVRKSKDEYGDVQEEVIGACLGYQDMAWLNGIPLMFFLPLLEMREIMYLFAGLIALFSVVQCYLRATRKQSEVTPLD